MLHHTFSHIPSVGVTTERKIWSSKITSLDDFIKSPPNFLSKRKSRKIMDCVQISKEKIINKDAHYFYDNLSSKEYWRIFKEFQDTTVYLDIETTGLSVSEDIITTISLYDGKNIKYYVNGKNLDDFKSDIMQYKVIVTYNGKTFDVPFIKNYFGINISHVHLDLRYILYSLGYSGGLKSCERQLGIGRTGPLADVDGFFAVLLWNDYKEKRNEKSLETLLAYNIEDVLNLEYLMVDAYNRKLKNIPLGLKTLDIPLTPDNPFNIDAAIVNKIKTQYYTREEFQKQEAITLSVDDAFWSWTPILCQSQSIGGLDQMLKATTIKTNPIDRHFLLQAIVSATYKLRNEEKYRKLCVEYAKKHLEEFPAIAPALKEGMGGELPRIITFQHYATVLTEDGEYENAISIYEKALEYNLRDNTKRGFKGRIEKIKKKAEKKNV